MTFDPPTGLLAPGRKSVHSTIGYITLWTPLGHKKKAISHYLDFSDISPFGSQSKVAQVHCSRARRRSTAPVSSVRPDARRRSLEALGAPAAAHPECWRATLVLMYVVENEL